MENKKQPQPNLLLRYLPIMSWLPNYHRPWLRTYLIAGFTVVALLIPEGMVYAQIAGVPPQTAFYAATMAGALVAALKAPLFAALFTLVLVQKETAPVIAVAVVVSALLTALLALRAARRLASQTESLPATE